MTGTTSKANSLQAILDRQSQATVEVPTETSADKQSREGARAKLRRKNTVLIGGHFPPSVAKQLGILAAEEETTKQELLGEALDLLFVKKGKNRIRDITL
ncbi:MAG: hypothetical protein OXE50_07345 [Chloroflexi bacterium]|nr:hypothetical protein [Chloroflexota bacterium]